MKPGLYLESVPCDIAGSPVMAVCDVLTRLFEDDRDISAGIGLAVTPLSPRHLWVSLIRAFPPGNGLGGRMMDALCAICDRQGVVIELHSVPVGDSGLGESDLRRFYARCGFVDDEEWHRADAMVRQPRRTTRKAA
jgi:hypothetical protein